MEIFQNVIFEKKPVQFLRTGEFRYDVRFKYDSAGTIIRDKQSKYWVYAPKKLLPQAPGLHAPQIMKSFNDLKTHLRSLV